MVYMKNCEDLAFPQEIKKTKQREEIFRILSEETEPVSAVDIYNRLAQTCGNSNFAISTVYRALGIFEEKGYVSKSTLMGGDMAYYEWNYGTHKHYAICLKCHKLIALKKCPFEHMKIETENDNFMITGHKLELYGYCKECRIEDEDI
ncbi:Fur family ferric uptake regulator [Kineothrix alysoides]|uniref:Fur family ferric uptake regulator n=2 Tax=Kineothrix alysoides TaxID=1469948 RepID=A0A4R1QTN9_9FIRM|nr:Fur family ferric uptake regulator [Kineothrix alysoides]